MNVGLFASFAIGGLLLLSILTLNLRMMESTTMTTLDQMAKENVRVISAILNHDLAKIGYSQSGPITDPITAADSVSISFKSDIDMDGTTEDVSLGYTTSEVTATKNPNDYYFQRTIDGTTENISLGITLFRFTYYDDTGSETTVTSDIKQIKVEMISESKAGKKDEYGRSGWEKLFTPVNLNLD